MMTDKMREAIIQFGQDNPSLDLDFRLHTHGKYLTQEKAIVASRAFKAGAAWQAAQSAAAPELLEALESMLEVHGVTQVYADKHIEIPQSWVDVSDKARAAIAKAKGETK